MLDATRDGGGWCCPASTTRSRPGSRSPADIAEPGVALVSGRLLADISRSLPARPVEVATDGAKVVVTCGSLAVHAAHAAGRGLPGAARDARCVRVAARRRVRRRGRPGLGRRRPRRHAAGAHRCPARDRGREDHHGGHRPLPAGGARPGLDPGAGRPVGDRPGAGPHPGRHREVAGRRPTRSPSRWPAAAGARAWSASRAPAGARPRGCSTASSRSTSSLLPAESAERGDGRDRRRSSSRYAGWRWSPSATPRSG